MYCPKCGQELTRRGKELYCVAGAMGLSQRMEEELTAAVQQSPAEPVNPNPGTTPGSAWFCPRCRAALVRSGEDRYDLRMHCPRCGLALAGRVVYDLVELHPHEPCGAAEEV